MEIMAFLVSIIAGVLSFFKVTRLPAFVFATFGIILTMIAAYQKGKAEKSKEEVKPSKALEVGSIINSGAVCLTYIALILIR